MRDMGHALTSMVLSLSPELSLKVQKQEQRQDPLAKNQERFSYSRGLDFTLDHQRSATLVKCRWEAA